MTLVGVQLEARCFYGIPCGEIDVRKLNAINNGSPGIMLIRIAGAFLCHWQHLQQF